MVYEWIQVKGAGPMSSSSGNTVGPIEALNLVPPEILRYLIAGSKMNRHIDFNTGSALFQMADEYERLVSDPPNPDNEELTKRQRVAAITQSGAMRLSQIKRGSDPVDSLAGVTFRHLAMLAQIKTSDDDVWNSLRNSGHLSGEPNSALQNRLERMRNWIGSIHFPEDARIHIQEVIDENSRAQLSPEQLSFLEKLAVELRDSEWSDEAIGNTIRMTSANSGVSGREAYIALYWAMLGRSHGPKASALIFEIGKSAAIELFGS
tara:strand:- start:26942 stop:27730 length:789 start_codon:yes stop_codon:yes gene_type:complete